MRLGTRVLRLVAGQGQPSERRCIYGSVRCSRTDRLEIRSAPSNVGVREIHGEFAALPREERTAGRLSGQQESRNDDYHSWIWYKLKERLFEAHREHDLTRINEVRVYFQAKLAANPDVWLFDPIVWWRVPDGEGSTVELEFVLRRSTIRKLIGVNSGAGLMDAQLRLMKHLSFMAHRPVDVPLPWFELDAVS